MMNSWVKLKDIAHVLNGYAFKSNNYVQNGIRIIRITNVQKGYIEDNDPKFYPIEALEEVKGFRLYENDLLMSLTGNVGRVALLRKEMLPAALNQRVACIRIKEGAQVKKEFLYHFMNSDVFELKCIESANGVAQKNLSTEWLKEFRLYLPSIEKQGIITKVLDHLSDLITREKQQLKDLDLLIKSRFIEMFGDPITNSKKKNETEFINVCKLQRGFDLPVKERDMKGNIEVFGSNGVLGFHNESKVKNGGVITGRSGSIGNVYYTLNDYWPLNTTLFSIDTHGNNIIYLAHLLKFFDLNRFAEGTGVPTLNRNIVHRQKIIDVALVLQNQFADFVAQVDKSKLAVQQSLNELETLKKSLMQQYFG